MHMHAVSSVHSSFRVTDLVSVGTLDVSYFAELPVLSFSASISFPESTFPLSSGTGNKRLWDKAFRMTRFLSWVQLRRRKRLGKMVTNAQEVFHDGIEFSVTKLGNPNLELKKEQYDVLSAICLEKTDVLTVLPTGFGKSLCYQALPAIFDFMESEGKQRESIVIVVSPLNALIRDQLQKLKGCVNVCVLQSTVEDEKQKVYTVPKDVNKCSLLFGHPEVFVDNKTVAKMLKGEEFQRRVRAIVIDEAHLVLQWYLYVLFQKLF